VGEVERGMKLAWLFFVSVGFDLVWFDLVGLSWVGFSRLGKGEAYPELGCCPLGKRLVAVEDLDGEEEEEFEELGVVRVEEHVGVFGHDLVDEGDAVEGDFRVGFGFCRGLTLKTAGR
jgi:hypothetical protein